MSYRLKHIYVDLLPIFVPYSILFGMLSGLYSPPDTKPIERFTNIIGYTGIGLITGIAFPITYPLFGLYVLSKH